MDACSTARWCMSAATALSRSGSHQLAEENTTTCIGGSERGRPCESDAFTVQPCSLMAVGALLDARQIMCRARKGRAQPALPPPRTSLAAALQFNPGPTGLSRMSCITLACTAATSYSPAAMARNSASCWAQRRAGRRLSAAHSGRRDAAPALHWRLPLLAC